MHPPLSIFISRTAALLAAGQLVVSLSAATPATATLNGKVFTSHGLVGVGRIPHDMKDAHGETFGSLSALAFMPGTWRRVPDGSYAGTLLAQPDRGYNLKGTTNYTPRYHKLAVTLRPAEGSTARQDQVKLTLVESVLFTEADGKPLTSLDPVPDRSGRRRGFPPLPQAFNGRISLDAEGLVVDPTGALWVSDEYGPYVYRFSAAGRLLFAIRPPEALIPKRQGLDSFSSNNPGLDQPTPSPADPTTGRQNNQGFEGLTVSPDGRTLFALLQSATRQDGGSGSSSPLRHHARLLAYDVTGAEPVLRAEHILPLPTYVQGTATRVAAQSELLAVGATQFLVLARDSGNGRGANPTSAYRRILIYDIAGATNLAGAKFDLPDHPAAPLGVLEPSIIPAKRIEWIDLNDAEALAMFGLHNGPADDANNLAEKWESLALVPALDRGAPNDWFLFVGNDNDFLTTRGFQDGAPYVGAVDSDSMVLVYRVTLPTP